MENKASYTIVGLFVIATVIALFGFAFWLAGGNEQTNFKKYAVYFDESVTGLTQGSAVRYRGVTVGKVTDITIDRDATNLIRVLIQASDSAPITVATRATLKFQGITGLGFIDLSVDSYAEPLKKRDNAEYAVIKTDQSSISKLFADAPDMLENANEVLARANLLLSIDNIENISEIIENTNKFSQSLAGEKESLAELIQQTSRVMKHVEKTSKSIASISSGVSQLVDGSKDNIISFSDSGLRSLTKFFNEARETADEVRDLARKIKENPSSIVYPEKQEGQNPND